MKHKVGERTDKCGRVVQSSGHMKLLDAKTLGDLARFDINLVQGFNVIGDEGNRHHENAFALS